MAQLATASHADTPGSAPIPRAPATIEDTGLGADQITQLFVHAPGEPTRPIGVLHLHDLVRAGLA